MVVGWAATQHTRRVTALAHGARLFTAGRRLIGRVEILRTLGVAERQQEVLRVLAVVCKQQRLGNVQNLKLGLFQKNSAPTGNVNTFWERGVFHVVQFSAVICALTSLYFVARNLDPW